MELVEIGPDRPHGAVLEAVVHLANVVDALLGDFQVLGELYKVLCEDVCQDCEELEEVLGHNELL